MRALFERTASRPGWAATPSGAPGLLVACNRLPLHLDGDSVVMSVDELLLAQSGDSVLIRGGDTAPERARSYVHEQLDHQVTGAQAFDVALVVSELVTNSVVHANVDSHHAVLLELTTLADRLRIAVTDPGSHLEPRIAAADVNVPGGFGLRLVDQISSVWGVVRGAAGTTRVWCDLPLESPMPS